MRKMGIELTPEDVGGFEISIVGDANGNSVSTKIEGSAIAILCGMNALTRNMMETFGEHDAMLKHVFVMTLMKTLNGENTAGIKFADEKEDATVGDIRPSASPDQKRFDWLFDKLFGKGTS